MKAGRTVLRLRIHPVKGARGSDVDQMDFDEVGPRFDRRWMVVGADGVFVSQRGRPELATVRVTVAGEELILQAPGAGAVAVPVVPEGGRV
ncbi:MAG: MOSC domain-containing protein, partial [Gemmatimonadetes bacterium]|nr:MOSC domain-containing protein [Gemmatimonadota bacterium]